MPEHDALRKQLEDRLVRLRRRAGRIASDYDLPRGGLLPIGLLVLAGAPLIAAKLRRVL